MFNQLYFDNQNFNMPMNMMNQNNMNYFCQNNMPMNMMNQYNNYILNQNNMNNMNMMYNINNFNMLQNLGNNMNNLNNMNNMNMNMNMNMDINMNNTMGNPRFNNMLNNNVKNFSGNENNNFNNNDQIFLMKNIFDNLKFEKDPYIIQKKIAFCMDSNKPNKNYVYGGNALFITSTNDENSNNKVLNDKENLIHIIFITMKGHNHSRKYNKNDKIKDVLGSFIREFGLPLNALKEIHFLYNATNINNLEDNNYTLKQLGIKNFAKINVVDMKNIIGAKNIIL